MVMSSRQNLSDDAVPYAGGGAVERIRGLHDNKRTSQKIRFQLRRLNNCLVEILFVIM